MCIVRPDALVVRNQQIYLRLIGTALRTQYGGYHPVRCLCDMFSFLVAHSMLHLCGYDHMEQAEAELMEEKQEAVLTSLGITREANTDSVSFSM